MAIIAPFLGDVQSYMAMGRWRPPLPDICPCCHAPSRFVGHGSYPRHVAEAAPWLEIYIPRLRCRSCGGTFGVVPSFLVLGRHYSACRIQSALSLHYQASLSRRQLSMRYQSVPALSTCFAWVRAFAAGADSWLHAVLRALTRFDAGYDPLHWLVSPVGKAHGPPRLLLDLLPQWLVAIGVTGQDMRTGLAQGLGLLLLWGQGQGLPRLL